MTAAPKLAGRTVLVADDTAFVRDRFKAAIESAGHKAVTVQTGQEVLAQIRANSSRIDLIRKLRGATSILRAFTHWYFERSIWMHCWQNIRTHCCIAARA